MSQTLDTGELADLADLPEWQISDRGALRGLIWGFLLLIVTGAVIAATSFVLVHDWDDDDFDLVEQLSTSIGTGRTHQ